MSGTAARVNGAGIWPDITIRPGESESGWLLRLLLQDLQTLASEADVLVNAFHPTIPAADEAALIFDDHFQHGERLVGEGLISREMLERIQAVNKLLSEMSKRHDGSLWSSEALRHRDEWGEVRRLARGALQAMGCDLEPPPHWKNGTRVVGARAAGKNPTGVARRKTRADRQA